MLGSDKNSRISNHEKKYQHWVKPEPLGIVFSELTGGSQNLRVVLLLVNTYSQAQSQDLVEGGIV